jgi:outer membrane protein OmpA-like peptidoglycan-associated protein
VSILCNLFVLAQEKALPKSIDFVSSWDEIKVGDVFLCPEVRSVYTPCPLIVKDEKKDSIQKIAEFIYNFPRFIFEIGVHTDSRGLDEANKNLSERIAKEIHDALIHDFSIDDSFLTYKGYGESSPIVSDSFIETKKENKFDYEQLYQINRRVELKIVGYVPDKIDSLERAYYTKSLSDSIFNTGDIIKLPELRFSLSGGSRLLDEYRDSLELIVDFLRLYPRLTVELGAHTDYRGNNSSNIKLAEYRAKSLVEGEFCQRYGLCSQRIKYKGYGEDVPIILEKEIIPFKDTDKLEYERRNQVNRRMELHVLGSYQDEIDSLLAQRYSKTMNDSTFISGDRIHCPEVRYKLASWEIDSTFYSSVERIAKFIKRNPTVVFEIGVHTETRGSASSSTRLSQRRAESIGDLLIEKYNVSPSQLKLKGYDCVDPLILDSRIVVFKDFEKPEFELRHQVNRRVELKVVSVAQD